MRYLSRRIESLHSVFGRDRFISPALLPAYVSGIARDPWGPSGWDTRAGYLKIHIGQRRKPLSLKAVIAGVNNLYNSWKNGRKTKRVRVSRGKEYKTPDLSRV